MNSNKTAQVVITVNSQQPKAAVRAMKVELDKLTKSYEQLNAAGKAGTQRAKNMLQDIKDLRAAIKNGEADLNKVNKVVQNLSDSSLRQLKLALAQVKKEMATTSESSGKLEELRRKYKAINDQIKVLEGSYVNINKQINNLGNATDSWLSRAIKQQKEHIATIDEQNTEYQEQMAILKKLEAEESRRKTKTINEDYAKALQTVSSGTASAEKLRSARSALMAKRDTLDPSTHATDIANINKLLKETEFELDRIAGKEEEIEPTVQKISKDVFNLTKNLNDATPEQLRKGLEACRAQLDKMGSGDARRKAWVKWANELEAALKGVDREVVDVDKVLRNIKATPLEKLKLAAKQLEDEMSKLERSNDNYLAKQRQLTAIKKEIEGVTQAVNRQASGWSTAFRNISMYFGVFQLFSIAQQKLRGLLNDNLAYSDQMADIRKVTGLTTKEVNQLSESIAKLDTRTAIQGLSDLAYQGGKMGFGRYGVEGMNQFVRAADQVKVALSDDLGDDSLLQISKLVDTMGLIPKLGVEKSMLATGSAINQLSATSTASGTHIVDFSKRLTGLSRITGITTPQLLALGSAADALGQAPEIAATTFGKLFTSLQNKHNLIEEGLGIDKGTINGLFSQGKAMEAILLIMEKMRDKGNMNALGNIWKDLGSEGQRLIGVMATMSKNVDTVRAHVEEAESAFEEATSLTNEYALKQETANAILERANSLWEKAFVNPDGVDMVKELTKAWYDLSKAMTSNEVSMGIIKGLLVLIGEELKILLALLPAILMGLMFKGASVAIIGVANSIGLMGQNAVIATFRTNGLVAAWKALNVAQKANVIGLCITLLASLAIAIGHVITAGQKATKWMEGFNSGMGDFNRETAIAQSRLDGFKKAIDEAGEGTRQRAAAIRNFKKEYGQYLDKMLTEKSNADEIAKAYKRVVEQLRAKIALQLKEKDIEKQVSPRVGWSADRLTEYDEQAEGTAYNSTWLKAYVDDMRAAGKSVEDISKDLAKKLGVNGQIAADAFKKRSQTSPTTWFNSQGYQQSAQYDMDGGFAAARNNTRQLTQAEKMVYAATRYASQAYSTANALDKVNKKWEPLVKGLDTGTTEESPGTLDNNAPNPEEEKRRRAEEAARRKALREEMREEQGKAKAIIDNVKNYYERQITAITEMATEGGMDPQLQKKLVDGMTIRMNSALANVRQAIAGTENEWQQFRETMIQDLYEPLGDDGTNQSTQLLDDIIHNDIDKLKEMITTLSKELGQNGSVLLDQIWRKATDNELKKAQIENKAFQERQKALLERNYTGKVNRNYEGQMEQLGVAELTANQMQNLMAMSKSGDTAGIQKFADARSKMWQDAFLKVRENMVQVFSIDVSKQEGQKAMLTLLFGADYETTLSGSALASMLNMDQSQWQVFYQKLIEYSDAYTEALKKARDEQKKILDFQWENTDTFHGIEDKQKYNEMQTSNVGQYSADIQNRKANGEKIPRNDIYGTTSFISSMGNDPEVEAYRLKMEAAEAYYNFLKAHQADAETLRDAEQGILKSEMDYAKSVAQQMKERMADVYALAAPVEEFGTNIGKAFATMTEDAEAGRKAIKAAIGDMINGFMEQTVKMTEEWIKRRLMQQMNDKLTSTAMKEAATEQVDIEEQKQDDLQDAQKEGGEAKQSIFKKIGNGFMSLFKKQKKDEVKMEEDKQDEIIETQETGGEAQEFLNTEVKSNISKATAEIGNETLQTEQAQVQQEVQTESAKTQANTSMGIASGASKIIGTLGWWGIPLIAVITALLNGLLSFAMSKVSSLFGGGSDSDDGGGQTAKLVTGMLTYDSGNVQAYAGVLDGKSYPVVGSDGNVYAATDGGELSTGLVKDPITTFVNGQPALVAEKGPEMVIGRETTAAMMMARPDLMAEIVKFDKNRSGMNYRVFDEGNIGEFGAFANPDGSPAAPSLSQEDVQQLRGAITEFTAMMLLLQKNGLHVNKYGRGGIAEEAEDGAQFMGRYSGSRLWNKKK